MYLRVLFAVATLLVCQGKALAQCDEAIATLVENGEHANQAKDLVEMSPNLNNYLVNQMTIPPPNTTYTDQQIQQNINKYGNIRGVDIGK